MVEIMYRDVATKIAFSFLGMPYVWGGDDPVRGFDCSGLCIEVLKSVGRLPIEGDWTAQDLFYRFEQCEKTFASEGCLVFWGESKYKIRHVEYCIDENLSIGASGGGSRTKDLQDAIQQNAYVKIRPFREKPGIVAIIDPFMKGSSD